MDTRTTIDNFNRQCAKQGGVAKLLELYKQGLSSPDIGKSFGLQGKQIDYYLKRITGQEYVAYPYRKTMADLGIGPRLKSD